MLGILVKTDGTMEIKQFNGRKELQEAVSGYYEPVRPKAAYEKGIFQYNSSWQHVFICNDIGLIQGLPLNPVGSLLYDGMIAGDIVILKESAHEGFMDMTDEEAKGIIERFYNISHKNCEHCKHSVDYGDSVEYIYCEYGKRKKDVKKTDTCNNYESR